MNSKLTNKLIKKLNLNSETSDKWTELTSTVAMMSANLTDEINDDSDEMVACGYFEKRSQKLSHKATW